MDLPFVYQAFRGQLMFWESENIQLHLPQSQSQSSHGLAINSQSSEEGQAQQPHPPQSLPDHLLYPTNMADGSKGFVTVPSGTIY